MADNINDPTKATTQVGTGVGMESADRPAGVDGRASAKAAPNDNSSKSVDKRVDKTGTDGERDDKREDRRRDAEAAEKDAAEKRMRLDDLRSKAADSKMSDEDRAIRDALREADDADAKAAEARGQAGANHPRVASDVIGHPAAAVAPDMALGDHMAQKFGNTPANPKPARGEHADPDKMTARMIRHTPDAAVPQETWVHPEMVGDYARAGWSVA